MSRAWATQTSTSNVGSLFRHTITVSGTSSDLHAERRSTPANNSQTVLEVFAVAPWVSRAAALLLQGLAGRQQALLRAMQHPVRLAMALQAANMHSHGSSSSSRSRRCSRPDQSRPDQSSLASEGRGGSECKSCNVCVSHHFANMTLIHKIALDSSVLDTMVMITWLCS